MAPALQTIVIARGRLVKQALNTSAILMDNLSNSFSSTNSLCPSLFCRIAFPVLYIELAAIILTGQLRGLSSILPSVVCLKSTTFFEAISVSISSVSLQVFRARGTQFSL